MLGFHEVQFPPKIAYGATGGPGFSTTITTMRSGFEQRNRDWEEELGEWEISTGDKTQSDIDAIISFFRCRNGRLYGFRLKDWTDYKAVAQPLGTGNGIKTTFQLVKIYSSGGYTQQRKIRKPVAATVKIYLNSILQSSGFTLDATTGIVTFATAPGVGVAVSADFEFDVPVRFNVDKLALTASGPGRFNWASIPLIEVRV